MSRLEPHRPQFHFSPARNWINDPNGLVWFDGEYHLFYQYNPFGPQWGHMSWGHAVSTNLIDWHELPVAIAEDDRVSIYSGSVVVDWHNSSGWGDGATPPLVAVYTGCPRQPDANGTYLQGQELAWSKDRGRTWHKYAHNPVLRRDNQDFRDPKVFWHVGTQRWVMVVVLSELRRAQFYSSRDLKQWTLLSQFEAPMHQQGIWECPDLMALPQPDRPDLWMLKVDVLHGHPAGGSGARIFFGSFDGTRFTADDLESPQWADAGTDFYAALSWSNLPNLPPRQIWLAWMSNHRDAQHAPTSPWRGAMTIPREVRAQRTDAGWQLLQQPVTALEALRGASWASTPTHLTDAEMAWLPECTDASALDVILCIEALPSGRCGLFLGWPGTGRVCIAYDAERGTVYVEGTFNLQRQAAGTPGARAGLGRHEVRVCAPTANAPLRLRALLDRSSVEVFVGDGEAVITQQVYPAEQARPLYLFAQGGRAQFGHGLAWPLRSAQMS